jgi:hypothetical protein
MFLSFRRKKKVSALCTGETAVVEGKVRAVQQLSLPGPGTKCVYYELLVETYKKGERGGGRPLWFPERSERRCTGFYINDGTGEVYVDCSAEKVIMNGGYEIVGMLDSKGRKRFSSRIVREGDTVRLRGAVTESSGRISKEILSIIPDRKGRIEMNAKPTAVEPDAKK